MVHDESIVLSLNYDIMKKIRDDKLSKFCPVRTQGEYRIHDPEDRENWALNFADCIIRI